MEHFAQD